MEYWRLNLLWDLRRVCTLAVIVLAAAVVLTSGVACRRTKLCPKCANVVLILVDALRADHLSIYGYPQPTSPALEALAARGTTFDNFYSHSATTRPSVATLFTSRYPSGHGIVDHGQAGLARSLPLLSELFDPAVYERMAYVTNPQIHPVLGFDRGFDRFESLFIPDLDPTRLTPQDLVKTPAGEVFSTVRSGLEEIGDRRFFTYIHLLDPHGPYRPGVDDALPFVDSAYSGPITGSIEDFSYLPAHKLSEGPDLDHFRGLYNGEIRKTDQAIGEFAAWLEATGRLDHTHLIITADHGEEFMEHGGTGHGLKLYQESVRVPLLWIGPGVAAGRRVTQISGLVDIAPTLAHLLGKTSAVSDFQGRSLAPLLAGEQPANWRSAIFLEGPGRVADLGAGKKKRTLSRGVVTSSHKVIARGCSGGTAGWESLELFDLHQDPEETHGLEVDTEGDRAQEIVQVIDFYENTVEAAVGYGAPASAPVAELPEETVEQLRALGYLQDG